MLRIDAAEQRLERLDRVAEQRAARIVEATDRRREKLLGSRNGGWKDRLEQAGQQAKAIQRQRADLLQFVATAVVFRQQPRRLGGDVAVDQIGNGDERRVTSANSPVS